MTNRRSIIFFCIHALLMWGCATDSAGSGSDDSANPDNSDHPDNPDNPGNPGTPGEDCSGCVAKGRCEPGGSPTACGQGGGVCATCKAGEICSDGACRPTPSCRAENCKGCCTADGRCDEGTAGTTCGKAGAACVACGTGAVCLEGTCQEKCGKGNCLGCCSFASSTVGTCVIDDDQSEQACGYGGAECTKCSAGDVCSTILLSDPGGTSSTRAGECTPASCSSCTNGCCAIAVGGGVSCDPGDGTSSLALCGKGGTCSICDSGSTCKNQRCEPDSTREFKLTILSVTVPAEDAQGSDWDYLSGPDPILQAQVELAPPLVSPVLVGTTDTTTSAFGGQVAVQASVADFQTGIAFKVWDDDSPDADDLIGASTPWIPTIDAFVEKNGSTTPYVVTFGKVKVTLQFVAL